MLENEVNEEERDSKEGRGDHYQDSRTLQLLPGRPRSLLYELYV